jgi:DEAD/DEAH box helicase domain-containing protein
MINEVIFDLETKNLFSDIDGNDPGNLGVSIVSLYQRVLNDNLDEVKGEIKSYWEEDFNDMWSIFQNADRIIGFNSKRFDVPALNPYASFPFEKLPHFDIFEIVKGIIGHRISLDSIAKITLKKTKTGVGTDAVSYWRKGDSSSLAKLKNYCEADVLITKDVYDFGVKEKALYYKDKWNTQRKISVNFEYKKELISTPQETLF